MRQQLPEDQIQRRLARSGDAQQLLEEIDMLIDRARRIVGPRLCGGRAPSKTGGAHTQGGTADHSLSLLNEKDAKECVMSSRHSLQKRSLLPHSETGDLRDWAIIGIVVIMSSLLVWGSILALQVGA